MFGAGMNQQIAIDGATDLHAIGAESQLGRYADRLAVAAHEHATGNGLNHHASPCIHRNTYAVHGDDFDRA
jgi:hypothetical protein